MAMQKILLITKDTKPWLLAASMLDLEPKDEVIEKVSKVVGVKGIELFLTLNVPLAYIHEMPKMPGKFFVSSKYVAEQFGLTGNMVDLFQNIVNQTSNLLVRVLSGELEGIEVALIHNEESGEYEIMARDLTGPVPNKKDFLH